MVGHTAGVAAIAGARTATGLARLLGWNAMAAAPNGTNLKSGG